ncbi:DUF6522 family protein [Sphingosinicella rhizophila]|uniref:DUF6522 family protein n=1 Tax=Sphingosinicella rhizophila TaxID=3050082 RepID=A0ABU3Q927_9SPHN|nr:DUF6522 family protein [Sphingosinicella sp. GR2756]MDT9599909.1 DUF6522 family protein [Sphingosinicella sp. GR2756]
MTKVEIGDDSFDIDASLIADGLGLAPSAVPELMKAGRITSLCERGEGADAGRHRLSLFHGNRRLRLVVDGDGNIVETSYA